MSTVASTPRMARATKAAAIRPMYSTRRVLMTFLARLMTTSKMTAATPARMTCRARATMGLVRNWT